jgi:hypothetical protein
MRQPGSKPSPKTKKTAFVPRSLFLKALAASSVIPLCACGGSVANPPAGGGVAAMAFDAGYDANRGYPDSTVYGVAQRAFDSGIDTSIIGTVAACCFDATFDVAVQGFSDAGDATFGVAADAFSPDVGFIVAHAGFDGSLDSGGNNPDAGS